MRTQRRSILWLIFGISAIFVETSGWSLNQPAQGGSTKCERLTVSFCRGLRYNLTAMPNFMGHEDQRQAERGLTAFMPLVHYNCSRHLRLFLCAVFAPVCSEHVAMQIPACKSLCLSVRRDCEPALTSLTLPWPHMLDCDRFLDRGNTLCVQPPEESLSITTPITPSSVQDQWPFTIGSKEKSLQTFARIRYQCPPRFVQTPDVEITSCSPKCGSDTYYRLEDKGFAERWMTGWAWLCFLSSLFTLLTFWLEPSRFRYPERPIVFLALSYNLLSLTYIVRGAVGFRMLSCASQLDGPSYVPVHDGLKSIPCTIWWIINYYVGLVSSCWWTILCGCWLLSARNEWSSEALYNFASYLHAVAWGFPILLTGGSLISRKVVADELTGTCRIAEESAIRLEVLPHAALLLTGCVFGAIAGAALFRVRRAMRATGRAGGSEKLERLIARLGIFGALYVLPALGWLACTVHESTVRPRWRTMSLLAALDCAQTSRENCTAGPVENVTGLEVPLLRIFLSLVVGVTSGTWVWSGKTCRAWSKLLAAPAKSKTLRETDFVVVAAPRDSLNSRCHAVRPKT